MDLSPCPQRGLVKNPQIGNVIIGNNVEIGANSCGSRKFSSTVLEMVVKRQFSSNRSQQ
jgi:UDP-3-O-[3-hydroxymyristoyl] glucosamine N-acyltransferase